MATFIALLRAVNVGGRVYKMADLRSCLEAAGLAGVETYIQTGNVRFATSMRSRPKIEKHVEDALAGGCGFDVPVILLTPAELRGVYDDARALDSPLPGDPRRYVTFLKSEPTPAVAEAVEAQSFDGEAVRVVGRALHVWLTVPTQKAKSYNTKAHKSLLGTTRALNVVRTLAERWGSAPA
ncbi:MAG TPA: DUF1697 domain-containing protein [Nocardioidaceae bacterium]|nr:DUF1697 domain-containing protein [Nocardioidaceae bacterium]